MISWGKYYWPYFLILVSALFLVPECIGLATNPANTLSEYSWAELNVHSYVHVHNVAWYLSQIAWLLFVVVITMHIWYRRFV